MTPRLKSITVAAAIAVMALAGCENAAQKEAKYLQRGKAQVAAGDFDKARLEFQNALQIDPKSVAAQFQLAQVQEKLENWRAAVGGYRAVIEADPKHVEAKARLARILLLAGQTDQAKKLIDEAKALDAGNVDVLTVAGAIAAKQGDTARGIAQGRAALATDPDHVDAIMLVSSLYAKEGKVQDAEQLLNDAIKAMPKDLSLHLALADLYAGRQDTDGAVAQLKEIIRLDPQTYSHRARLASYYIHLGKHEEAERVLRDAVADNGRDSRAKLALVSFLARYRDRGTAERELEGFIQKGPDDYALRFGLAALYLDGKDTDKAKAVYHAVIDRDGTGPNGLRARVLLAKVLVKENKAGDALALLNQVLKENATDNDALLLRGIIELARNDSDSAVTDFRAVQKDQPNSVEVADLLARAQLAGGHPDLAEDQLKRAVDLQPKNGKMRLEYARLLAGNKDSADQALEQIATVLKSDPKNSDALQLQFDVQMAKRDWAAAGRTAQRMKRALPDDAQGAYMLGQADQADGKLDDAARQFKAVLAKKPDAGQPLSALVKVYLAQKRPKDALKAVNDAVRAKPDNAVAYNLKGELLMLQKDPNGALTAFKQANEKNPKWDIPYRNEAAMHLAAKDPKAAEQTYQAGIKATDHAQSLVFDLAALYENRGNHDAAIAQYEEAVRQTPDSVAAVNNLAMMLVTYRHDQATLDRAKRLVEGLAASTNPAYLDTYGWVLYKSGDLAPAVDAFRKAVQQVPSSGLLHYHLGMALYGQGDTAAARDNLEQALKAQGNFAGRDEAKATLDKIAG